MALTRAVDFPPLNPRKSSRLKSSNRRRRSLQSWRGGVHSFAKVRNCRQADCEQKRKGYCGRSFLL